MKPKLSLSAFSVQQLRVGLVLLSILRAMAIDNDNEWVRWTYADMARTVNTNATFVTNVIHKLVAAGKLETKRGDRATKTASHNYYRVV